MTTRYGFDFGAKRIWAVILFVIVLGVMAGGYGFYRVEVRSIRLDKYNELTAIGELKAGQIAQWRQERRGDASVNAGSPVFREAVEVWLKDSGNLALQDDIRQRFRIVQETYEYADALLLDPDGRILLAVKDGPGPVDAATMTAIAQALKGKQAVLSDLFRGPDGNVYIDAVAPVPDANNQPIAIVVLRSDAAKFLYPLIQSWPIPSQSAETLLVRNDGDAVLFLNELRHQTGTALSLRIPLTQSDNPAVQGVRGKQTMFEGKDYRGVEVLAYLEPVPGSPWFMVAKVDSSEIMAVVNYVAGIVVLVTVLFILLTAAMIAFLYRQRQVRIYRVLYASEREKHKAQELLRATLIGIGDGVISTDERGCIAFINPVAQTLTGWPHAEARGKPMAEVFHIVNAQTRERCENPVEKVLASGEVVGLANHTLLIARDGAERKIADSGAPIRDIEGNIIGVVLVFRDVTEEYRMQEALRESEERYRTVAEFTYDWEYWIGPDRRFIYCSPACERITSYRAEEFEKDPGLLIAITHPDDHDQVVCYMDDIVAPNSESHELEFRILTRSGEVRWIAHACRVVRGQDGTYRGRRASNRDITERKQMQEALQKAFDDIKTLRGILPICMHCKKIRDDKGYWKAVEVYVGAHTEAQFSHGICPECVKEYYPELEKDAAGSQELGTS